MEATDPMDIRPAAVPKWIILLRHLVGVAILSAVLHFFLFRGTSASAGAAVDWALKFSLIAILALIANCAWALFFTTRSKGHFAQNLVRLIWVLVPLVAAGEWSSVKWRSDAAVVPSTSSTPSMQQQESAGKERKVDELRRLHSRFAGMSDADVLREIARDYPEVPIERIAADLGLKIVRDR